MATWGLRCDWRPRSPDVEDAPFYADLADGPENFRAVWRNTSDGVRLRMVWWPSDGTLGTIMLFQGRTEYTEKYGRIAREFTDAGFDVVTVDWRGQGMSDRVADDPHLGHVSQFLDYQTDVAALVELVVEAELSQPWFLIGHSMGGCIGLRSLTAGLNVQKSVFSAPMWGIQLPAPVRPLPHIVPPVARVLRMQNRLAPGARPTNYVAETGFADNLLTNDIEAFEWLAKHAEVQEFALGGPSVQWMGEATTENKALAALPRPDVPVITFLGTQEAIVSSDAIRRIHANWPGAELRIVENAKHEVMMEADPARRRFIDETLEFFRAV